MHWSDPCMLSCPAGGCEGPRPAAASLQAAGCIVCSESSATRLCRGPKRASTLSIWLVAAGGSGGPAGLLGAGCVLWVPAVDDIHHNPGPTSQDCCLWHAVSPLLQEAATSSSHLHIHTTGSPPTQRSLLAILRCRVVPKISKYHALQCPLVDSSTRLNPWQQHVTCAAAA